MDQGFQLLPLCGPLCWAAVFPWETQIIASSRRNDLRGSRGETAVFLIISPLKAYASISAVSYWLYQSGGFRIGSVVENLPAMQETQETWVQFLGWEGPL